MYFPFAKDEAGQKAPYKIEKMKYYLIAGEPSGDLHGANLIRGLQKADPGAEFRFWGGDCIPVGHLPADCVVIFKSGIG